MQKTAGRIAPVSHYDLQPQRPRAEAEGVEWDSAEDGSLAWIGVVLVVFSALATISLIGWVACVLLS